MTVRSSTSLATLADDVARRLQGVAHILDPSEYGSASIALDGWHRVLLRRHAHTFGVSLPHTSSWQLQNADAIAPMVAELRAALRAPRTIAIADAVVSFAPLMRERQGSAWSVRFPGTPIPAEAWMRHDERSLGIFQERSELRLVIWIGTTMLEERVRALEELRALAPWLNDALERQEQALEDNRREKLRADALPKPDYEAVMLALRNGARISVGGGRWSQTFFWDAGLKQTVLDEGFTHEPVEASEKELRQAIDLYPEVFRNVIRNVFQKALG